MNQTIKMQDVTGKIVEVPLTEETMDTMTRYFELKDGIYYFSRKKQKDYFKKVFGH